MRFSQHIILIWIISYLSPLRSFPFPNLSSSLNVVYLPSSSNNQLSLFLICITVFGIFSRIHFQSLANRSSVHHFSSISTVHYTSTVGSILACPKILATRHFWYIVVFITLTHFWTGHWSSVLVSFRTLSLFGEISPNLQFWCIFVQIWTE